MKIVSYDIETTGVSKQNDNQILELGFVLFDTDSKERPTLENCPTLNLRIIHHFISGNPFALNMNKQLIEDLSFYLNNANRFKKSPETFTEEEYKIMDLYVELEGVHEIVATWLKANGAYHEGERSFNIAGKNLAGFDIPFSENTIPGWNDFIRAKRRTIDPAVFYVLPTDTCVPNLEECKKRSGLFEDNVVTHNAVEDALDVAVLVHNQFNVMYDLSEGSYTTTRK
ncbi:gp167 [Sphingomonas phage PAU]|uniref:gp167 n=1 Tax=Sphingomonas phage PAU TaxID=1150991 RepID=UPI00025732F3|nr:gp167 [Sphingomonas phage PAU]AFF28165.1 gp167 [Sphingomonas phage PAU]